MSVLMVSPEIYGQIFHRIYMTKDKTQVDIDYCQEIRDFDTISLKAFITELSDLNEKSYNRAYKEKSKTMQSNFINFNHAKFIDVYQFLKYLHCIDYNIEIKNKKAVKKLRAIIKCVEFAIIDSLPQYKAAKEFAIIDSLPQYKAAKWSN